MANDRYVASMQPSECIALNINRRSKEGESDVDPAFLCLLILSNLAWVASSRMSTAVSRDMFNLSRMGGCALENGSGLGTTVFLLFDLPSRRLCDGCMA